MFHINPEIYAPPIQREALASTLNWVVKIEFGARVPDCNQHARSNQLNSRELRFIAGGGFRQLADSDRRRRPWAEHREPSDSADWGMALQREVVIRPLAEQPRLTEPDVAEAASRLRLARVPVRNEPRQPH
jgi:hypothetical protein